MRIDRKNSQDGTIAPSAINNLGAIPDSYYFINQHARRPPLGIYNVSFALLATNFDKLLDEYFKIDEFIKNNIHQLPHGKNYYDNLLKAQNDLIHSLQAHIDDCYSILASLIDQSSVPTRLSRIRFTDKWLKALNFHWIDQFKESISDYRDNYLAHLINGLKHRQNRLRGIFFYSEREVRLGYYLEEPDVNGIVGPSVNLHEDGNSAFSFARDILFNLYHVYYISDMLVVILRDVLKHYYSFSLIPQRIALKDNGWTNIIRRASKINPSVFPEEVDKPYPYLSFNETENDKILSLMYPVTIMQLTFPRYMRCVPTFEGDGVSRIFKIPYLKP